LDEQGIVGGAALSGKFFDGAAMQRSDIEIQSIFDDRPCGIEGRELPVDPVLAGFPLEFCRHARTLGISSAERRFRKRKYFIIEPKCFGKQYAGVFLMLRQA
jgi:hypothetical protein